MSLLTFLLLLAVLDILTGGWISASLFGLAVGGLAGAGRGALNAVTPTWRRGVDALKQHWWGALLASMFVGVWKLGSGAVVGAYRGAGPGYLRGHQIRRQGHEWAKAKVSAWQTPIKGETPGATPTPTGEVTDTAPIPVITPTPAQPPTSGTAPAVPATPTTPTGGQKEVTGMAGEDKGARPYVSLWTSKIGSVERPHAELAALRDELRQATEANGRHEVGGAQDALDKLTAAIEAVGDAGEALDVHANALDSKWSTAVENLDKVGADSAKELAGTA